MLDARREGKSLSLTPKSEKVKEYNTQLQAELQVSSFNDPNCNSWYKNDSGRITNNWSKTVVDYQHLLEKVDYQDYDAEGTGVELVNRKTELKVGRVKEESSVSDRTLMLLGGLSTVALVGGWILRNSRYLASIRAR